MISDFCIIPECFADTLLIETLVKPRERKGIYNHQRGCFQVAREMQSKNFENLFALGITDDDDNKPPYFRDFDLLLSPIAGLKLYRHKHYPTRHHYFITISPALELWMLDACDELGISMIGLGIADDVRNRKSLDKLKAITKTKVSLEEAKAEIGALFQEMRRKGTATPGSAVHTIIHWLETLRDKNYTVTEADLSC